MNWVI